ncbi:MAG: glycosyltransferase [Rubrobacteraceae bacterium]
MRITILTVGSRGDVEPCVALGLGLREAGCTVTIASHSTFKGLIEGRGFTFAPLSVDPRAVVESLARSGGSATGIMKGFRRVVEPALYAAAEEAMEATKDADALLVSPAAFLGYDVADARDLPAAGISMSPLIAPTSHFPNALMPASIGLADGSLRGLGALYNRLTHLAAAQLLWQPFRKAINRIRCELFSLPPHPFLGPLLNTDSDDRMQLYGWSNELLPGPPDWDENRQVSGYWFLDSEEGWEPPAALARFLESGPPPVCMGFGSSYIENAPRIASVFAGTLAGMGQRGILLGGWGELRGENPHKNILEIEEVPYDWLLPRTRGFVHHGSTGATHAALRAKIPSVTVPSYGDQLLWGQLLSRRGVAPAPIHRRKLSAEYLARAVSRIIVDPRLAGNAARLGEKVGREDGVPRAVDLVIQRFLPQQNIA